MRRGLRQPNGYRNDADVVMKDMAKPAKEGFSASPPPIARGNHGRFIAGNSGNGGRKPGARSLLGQQFLEDLKTVWERRGLAALEACAVEEPAQFCRIISNLLPKELDITASVVVDTGEFLDSFRRARELVGNGKVIEHGGD